MPPYSTKTPSSLPAATAVARSPKAIPGARVREAEVGLGTLRRVGGGLDEAGQLQALEVLAGADGYDSRQINVKTHPYTKALQGDIKGMKIRPAQSTIGQMVTMLGGHPSLKIGPLLETEKHDIGDILRESLEQESTTLAAYYELMRLTEGKSVALEEYAREMILLEEMHLDEVNKMLRKPGEIEPFKE